MSGSWALYIIILMSILVGISYDSMNELVIHVATVFLSRMAVHDSYIPVT